MSAPSAIEARFRAATPRSAEHAVIASAVMPGGDTRAAGHHPPYQLTMVGGEGAWLTDLDGHRYLDLIGNFTSLVHGNAYPPILDAARDAMAAGTNWPARNTHAVALAEELVRRVGSVEQVRFTNSGSEATLLAAEIARVVTGRPLVMMARYGYHGCAPHFECGTMGHDGPQTVLFEFGDLASVDATLDRHGSQVACVLVEPVLGSSGLVAAQPEFLAALRDRAHRAGALLIFDEVITLRLAPGGYQAVVGVAPDLTAMAKIIGGGFPVGAVGGSRQLMGVLDPHAPRLFHSGTFNGNPVTAAAGLVSLQHLSSDAIAELDRRAARLDAGLLHAAAAAGVPLATRRVGSLLQLYVQDEAPALNTDRQDGPGITLLHLAALNHGVFAAARGMLALSTVLDDDLVEEAIDRYRAAFTDLAAEW
ncbi:MAG: aspartate aminotransferase family protein [Acidimicrobiales bacterium]